MGEGFDELTRAVSASHSRRGVLKMLGGAAAAAAAATVLRPFRGDAAACRPGETPCGPNCCKSGVACVNARTGVCGCPAGKTKCGTDETGQPVCCTGTCSDPTTHCCCASGTTPCGPNCCKAGIACVDKASGTCGCPAGTTPCGSGANLTCCSAGQPCNSTNSVCAPPSSTCAGCTGSSGSTCSGCTTCINGIQPVCGKVPGSEQDCLCFERENATCVCVIPHCLGDCHTDTDCGPNAICDTSSGCCAGPGDATGSCLALCNGTSGGVCGTCGCKVRCGPGGECANVSTTDGTCACVVPTCGTPPVPCTGNNDCDSGQVCGARPCCGQTVCLDLCGAPGAAAATSSGSGWATTTRPYGG